MRYPLRFVAALVFILCCSLGVGSPAFAESLADVSSSPVTGKVKLKIGAVGFKAKWDYEYILVELNSPTPKEWHTNSFESAPDLNFSGVYKLKNSRKAKLKVKAATLLDAIAVLENLIAQEAAEQGVDLDLTLTGVSVKATYRVNSEFEKAKLEFDIRFTGTVPDVQGVVEGRLWTPKPLKSIFLTLL